MLVERIEAYGAPGHAVVATQHVHGARVAVVLVEVGAGEDRLLVDEHRPADRVVRGQRLGGRDGRALEPTRPPTPWSSR